MYTEVKTHKLPKNTDYSKVNITDIKVRPIVACCGGPTEKLAWLVTDILKPLLQFVTSNLNNIFDHLERLRMLSKDDLKALKFFTADITALYTNLRINGCLETILNFAEEHWDSLSTCLTLTEIRDILVMVLSNSYFTFNGRMYKQII